MTLSFSVPGQREMEMRTEGDTSYFGHPSVLQGWYRPREAAVGRPGGNDGSLDATVLDMCHTP